MTQADPAVRVAWEELRALSDAGLSEADRYVHEAYGALKEAVHFSGYGFGRLCDRLEWLLKEDRWRHLGYGDINKFLGTIDLSFLNLGGKRPKLVQRIKELQPDASQRAIGRMVGVDEGTVRKDLRGENPPPQPAKSLKPKGEEIVSAEYSAPSSRKLLNSKGRKTEGGPNGAQPGRTTPDGSRERHGAPEDLLQHGDPVQEFAERVANKLCGIGHLPPFKDLADIIADELRADGWKPLAQVEADEDSLVSTEATA